MPLRHSAAFIGTLDLWRMSDSQGRFEADLYEFVGYLSAQTSHRAVSHKVSCF